MSTAMRRFRLYGSSERKTLAEALDSCLQAWSCEWLGDGMRLESNVNTPDQFSLNSRQHWHRMPCDGAVVAYSLSPGFSKRLAVEAGWCDSAATRKASSIWDATIVDGVDALARRILAQAGIARSNASFKEAASAECDRDAAWSAYASGYVLYSVTLGQESLDFVLDPDAAHGLIGACHGMPSGGILSSRLNAISNGVCKLELVAGAAEVTVGELHALSPGQVVRLDKVVGQPLSLRTQAGEEIAHGYLAACGARKAVHLVQQ